MFARGGDSGYVTEGDVLVNQAADGVDLNSIRSEAANAMAYYNRERSALAALRQSAGDWDVAAAAVRLGAAIWH
ncbi:hypothetical protein [Rhodococcus marinonascens]|uniref:hypothetical protein n=1 Tax=Rhodococcus marinonascens TaxID=38311 RepID=UPI000934CDE3|nr:hypothetical protein [Rhodococcus marinonascens]